MHLLSINWILLLCQKLEGTTSTPQFLSTLSGGGDFDWHCLPPRGRSGEVLLGVKCDSLEVRSVVLGDFAVKFRVRTKADGFDWALVAVYGAAQSESSQTFWRI